MGLAVFARGRSAAFMVYHLILEHNIGYVRLIEVPTREGNALNLDKDIESPTASGTSSNNELSHGYHLSLSTSHYNPLNMITNSSGGWPVIS